MDTRQKFYKVYKHTAPNGKVYIGITCRKLKERWANGTRYHHNAYFTNAIKKYGWDNIKHEVLFEDLSKEEATQKEIELISFYQSNNSEYGYNQSTGGECGATGYKRTPEQCEAISKRMKGRTISEEERERLRRLRKGVPNSQEAREKMSKARKGVKHSEEWTKKIADANRGQKRPSIWKAVVQMDLEGNDIRSYESITEASKQTGIHTSEITRCAQGGRKTSGGYKWRYKSEA